MLIVMTDGSSNGPWPTRATAARVPVSESAIVEAALAVLNERGADGLTMRAVADRVGATTPTIYWHVNNKDGLIDRLFDRLCGEVDYPSADEPCEQRLHDLAHSIRRVLEAHRDAARLAIGRFPIGPNGLRATETVLAAFTEAGLTPETAAHAAFTYFGYITSFCYQETVSPAPAFDGDRNEVLSRIGAYLESLPPEQFPNTRGSARALSQPALDERFEFGLLRLIRGLTDAN
jgi:TetR/AcrR family transcriptional regulator, tetracycline repressor protein